MAPMAPVFVVVCLFARHVLVEASPCNASEYLDSDSSVCTPCSDCTSDGRLQYSPCSANRDAICFERCPDGSFFNGTSCQTCSSCSHPDQIRKQCTTTNNTVCDECDENYKYSETAKGCIINCLKCPSRVCDTLNQCQCDDCRIGRFCENTNPECITDPTTTSSPDTESQPSQSTETSSFSPVTSALVAVGAVMGIVIFSVLFVLLGVATSCRKGTASSSSAESSNGSTDTHLARTSSSLTSLYANHQSPSSLTDYRTSIDFSNGGLYSHTSLRESPRLGRPLSASSRNRDRVWTPV